MIAYDLILSSFTSLLQPAGSKKQKEAAKQAAAAPKAAVATPAKPSSAYEDDEIWDPSSGIAPGKGGKGGSSSVGNGKAKAAAAPAPAAAAAAADSGKKAKGGAPAPAPVAAAPVDDGWEVVAPKRRPTKSNPESAELSSQ